MFWNLNWKNINKKWRLCSELHVIMKMGLYLTITKMYYWCIAYIYHRRSPIFLGKSNIKPETWRKITVLVTKNNLRAKSEFEIF